MTASKNILIILTFFYAIATECFCQSFILEGGPSGGIPLWTRYENEYMSSTYGGFEINGLLNKNRLINFGFHLKISSYDVSNKVEENINSPIDFFDRTLNANTFFDIGPNFWKQLYLSENILLKYGVSTGVDFTYRSNFSNIYYSKDPILDGFNYKDILIYNDEIFSSIGYFIMPWIDLTYIINLNSENTLGLYLGLNFYYNDGVSHSNFEVQADNEAKSLITTIKTSPSLFGAGYQFGFSIYF